MDHLVIEAMQRQQRQRAEELAGFAAAAMDMLAAVPALGLDRLLDDHELRGRARAVDAICDQVLFLTMCALRAFCGVISAPRVLIYGPGFVGGRVVDRLIEHGCGPMLRVFVRNALALHKWRAKGLKASDSIAKLLRAGTFEIVINCSNYASFVQFTRDLLGRVSPKTCLITASFGLQRSRLYQILKTPCVFRTFVERIDVARYVPDSKSPPRSPSSHEVGEGEEEEERDIGEEEVVPHDEYSSALPPKGKETEYAAQLFATRLFDIKRQLLLLENYYVLWGMGNERARREALRITLGDSEWSREKKDASKKEDAAVTADPAATDAPGQSQLGAADAKVHDEPSTFLDDEETSLVDEKLLQTDTPAAPSVAAAGIEAGAGAAGPGASPVLVAAMDALLAAVGSAFQRELSKIARIGDLAEYANQNWSEAQRASTMESYDNPFSMSNMVVVLSDLELKSIYRHDNQFPEKYYVRSVVLDQLDREEDELGAIRPRQKGTL